MTGLRQKARVSADDSWTVRRILAWTTAHLEKHGSDTPRLDAEILLAHARGCPRIQLYTRFDEVLSDAERAVMRDLVRRRAQSEPVAYLVGHREFFGLDFRVTPDVLIPRPETETLVLALLDRSKELPQPKILDLCTGSGCIAVAAAVQRREAQMTAVDVSAEALEIARQNVEKHKVLDRIRLVQGDLFAPLDHNVRYDVIASNPPYVAEGELETLQADVRLYEPRLALAAGTDGLSVIRRLVAEAPNYLASNGTLLFEFSPEQSSAVLEILQSNEAFTDSTIIKDLSGNPRVAVARRHP